MNLIWFEAATDLGQKVRVERPRPYRPMKFGNFLLSGGVGTPQTEGSARVELPDLQILTLLLFFSLRPSSPERREIRVMLRWGTRAT